MKDNLIKIFIFMLLVIGLVGCNVPAEDDEKDPVLYLVSDNFMLYIGDEREIEYYVDNLEDYELSFEVGDESIFSVENGKVKALKVGNSSLRISIVGYEDIYEEATIRVIQESGQSIEIHNTIINHLKSEIGTDIFEAKLFPTEHATYPDAVITYESSNPSLISNRGLVYAEDYDKNATINISVNYNGIVVAADHEVTVVGKIPNNIAKEFLGQFYMTTTGDVNINYLKEKYPAAVIGFRSGNETVLSNTGKFTKPENDTFFVIYATISIPSMEYSREFSKPIKGQGLSVSEKALKVKDDIIDQLSLSSYKVTGDLALPTTESRYNGTITWSSPYPDVLSNDGKVNQPLINTLVELRGSILIGVSRSSFILELEVMGRESDNKWDDIQEFLDLYLFVDEIETMKYSVMGVKPTYTAFNDGYVLFYENKDLDVIQDILPVGHKHRPGSKMTVQSVTIHDTANNGEGAGAEMHSRFIHNEDRTSASWHYTIDDFELYQHVPLTEVAWHAGDGFGNRTSIGIETCTNLGGDYDLVIRRTAKLVAKLLDDHDLTLNNVKQHYYWTAKNCPQVIRASNRWGELINLIGMELYGRQHLSGVKFEWESLSPTILDNTGKVFAHPGSATEVSYRVNVTYNGETRTFDHTSTLQAKK